MGTDAPYDSRLDVHGDDRVALALRMSVRIQLRLHNDKGHVPPNLKRRRLVWKISMREVHQSGLLHGTIYRNFEDSVCHQSGSPNESQLGMMVAPGMYIEPIARFVVARQVQVYMIFVLRLASKERHESQ